ncbi:MAG: protein-L-isoaspartate(D-aspartate) O-methyltransferase [Actinomycetota bacterium]|nr:protein-L-isoaspartate(D-aspartate) O-methyltransferase [Actinomycetota bacterium]
MSQSAKLARRLGATIRDPRVLEAIAALPRERFVPASEQDSAYKNVALPIACGQTISQPVLVARMLELLELRPDDRVLDVGTGSGYHAALLARLVAHVWTVERIPELSHRAQLATAALGIDNVTFVVADGAEGIPSAAPFDAINVAAAGEAVPPALEAQLAPGGRLVAPVGDEQQHLVFVRRGDQSLERLQLEPVRFVPLVSDPETGVG